MAHVKQTSNPCFCSRGCPPGTRPNKQWAVRLMGFGLFTEYEFHKLYRISSEGGAFAGCTYLPVNASSGYTKETMLWDVQVIPASGPTEYVVELFLTKPPGPATQWGAVFSWMESELPLLPSDVRNCQENKALLEIPGSGSVALVSPAPEWVCDDTQLRTWCTSTGGCS